MKRLLLMSVKLQENALGLDLLYPESEVFQSFPL